MPNHHVALDVETDQVLLFEDAIECYVSIYESVPGRFYHDIDLGCRPRQFGETTISILTFFNRCGDLRWRVAKLKHRFRNPCLGESTLSPLNIYVDHNVGIHTLSRHQLMHHIAAHRPCAYNSNSDWTFLRLALAKCVIYTKHNDSRLLVFRILGNRELPQTDAACAPPRSNQIGRDCQDSSERQNKIGSVHECSWTEKAEGSRSRPRIRLLLFPLTSSLRLPTAGKV